MANIKINPSDRNKLTPEEEEVIVHKQNEYPGMGELLHENRLGTFVCRRCDAPLYYSKDKFDSGCGRPSFDDAIPGAIHRSTDEDGIRTEIMCANCTAHLGHVFVGERMTEKNTRHCVASLSMKFVPTEKLPASGYQLPTLQKIYFGGGCFWCIEAVFQLLKGVIEVKSGYMGGKREFPTSEQVYAGVSGHIEVVQVIFDPHLIPLDVLLDVFFTSHDPTSMDQQGHDIGEYYRSIIFYTSEEQKEVIEKRMDELNKNTYDNQIVTQVQPAQKFWIAEEHHQNFYMQNASKPYCQIIIDPKIKKLREGFEGWLKI